MLKKTKEIIEQQVALIKRIPQDNSIEKVNLLISRAVNISNGKLITRGMGKAKSCLVCP